MVVDVAVTVEDVAIWRVYEVTSAHVAEIDAVLVPSTQKDPSGANSKIVRELDDTRVDDAKFIVVVPLSSANVIVSDDTGHIVTYIGYVATDVTATVESVDVAVRVPRWVICIE